MKKTIIHSGKKAMLFLTLLSIGLSDPLHAANPGSTNTAELKFLGNHDKYPTFRLDLRNSESGEFLVVVKDGYKDVLLSEKLKGENISRIYKLDATDMDLVNGTIFEVTNLVTNETRVFKINKTYREIVDIAVSK